MNKRMKIETSKLTDAALDWAVEVAEEMTVSQREFQPSTNWDQGGPIIERERMTVEHFVDDSGGAWLATHIRRPYFNEETGPTPLIAAMRCYVASRLGDEVDIPEELCVSIAGVRHE